MFNQQIVSDPHAVPGDTGMGDTTRFSLPTERETDMETTSVKWDGAHPLAWHK